MIALLLCGLIAGACAAPQFGFSFGTPQFQMRLHPYVSDDIFDTGRFWSDLSREMRELDEMLADLTRRFPATASQEGIEGSEYKIRIALPDFEEKDIVVKAREGMLMIQAHHKYAETGDRNYLNVRTLPDNVNVTGNWIFENGVLKITFPLKGSVPVKPTESIPATTEVVGFETTRRPNFEGSREEIETNHNEGVQDVDVGLGRGDLDKESELKTNEIPNRNTVEATTYAVDLKDEVEFVPVRY